MTGRKSLDPTPRHALLVILDVYDPNTKKMVGEGYAIYTHDWRYNPILNDLEGKPLEPKWYELISKENYYFVMSERIH